MRTGCETPRFPHMQGLLLATTENSRTRYFQLIGRTLQNRYRGDGWIVTLMAIGFTVMKDTISPCFSLPVLSSNYKWWDRDREHLSRPIGQIVPVPDHRSGHPRVRVRFRMPPPESLMSSGDSCTAKGTGFCVPYVGLVIVSCQLSSVG